MKVLWLSEMKMFYVQPCSSIQKPKRVVTRTIIKCMEEGLTQSDYPSDNRNSRKHIKLFSRSKTLLNMKQNHILIIISLWPSGKGYLKNNYLLISALHNVNPRAKPLSLGVFAGNIVNYDTIRHRLKHNDLKKCVVD